jgi:hypothetical protein
MRTKTAILLVAAGLAVTACGKKTEQTTDNSEVTEMNSVGTMEGTTNDMSAMDTANDTNMSADNSAMAPADNATTGDNASNSTM